MQQYSGRSSLFRAVAGAFASVMFALSVAVAPVSAAEFVEGEHYERLAIPVETGLEDKVQVLEVFSYACIHCYNFDPTLEAWAESQDAEVVVFDRVPAIFNKDWELLALAYYTAETLGVRPAVHTPIFRGVHDERKDLRQPDLLAALFAEHAQVSKEDFNAAYNSFSVRSQVQQAKARTRAYRVTGVPTLIVNGKYRVDGRMAGNNTNMLRVVEHLVALESGADS